MPAPMLVAVGRGWTPEEAARHEVALYRHLASDKKALRVFLQKVRVVEMVRTSRQQQVVSLPADSINPQIKPAAGAGERSPGLPDQPLAAATKPRARRRKSEAQRRKSVLKLLHKKLQTRCESAANKAGGSPPKVLARVLACCGRFIELLHPEGAERMERLRQVEAASRERCGLEEAMREAPAATSAAAEPAPMDVGKASVPNLTLTHQHPPSPGSCVVYGGPGTVPPRASHGHHHPPCRPHLGHHRAQASPPPGASPRGGGWGGGGLTFGKGGACIRHPPPPCQI